MIELTPRLDLSSEEALYMQLYQYIRDEIVAGRIPTDKRLPSIRTLCDHLGVSRTPIAVAYDQLLAEGFIRSEPRRGYFAIEVEASHSTAHGSYSERSSSPQFPALLRAYHATQEDKIRYDFGYGSIDLDHFPLTKWRKLINRCLLPENSRLLLYGDLQGDPGLRTEIATYLHQIRGVRCSPDQIIIGAGTYHSLDLLFQLLREEVTCLAVEASVNDGVKSLLDQFRFDCRPLQLESDGIRIEEIYESDAQAIYVTPSHQFPFGMTLSANKRIKLLNWAMKRQSYIIENDYDGEFRYNGRPIPSLQSLDDDGRVVYVGTFSKALTPAFRLSYLVLPPVLLERFRLRRHSYDQLASPIFQKTLQWFMETGDFERHMRKMRRMYHKKHDLLLQSVRHVLQDLVELIGTGSGLHILLRVRNGMSEDQLVQTARQAGVHVYPVSVYALQPRLAVASTVLLGFGGLSETDIRTGIERLREAWIVDSG